MKVRVKFAKYGAMKFIGHLDMMRFFQKAVRRAGIDIKYSEGFSPHQIMSFAAPLGVGIESMGEYFDMEINDGMPKEIENALNRTMVEGIQVLSVQMLPDTAKNAMASVAAAAYQIHSRNIDSGRQAFAGNTAFGDRLSDFYAQEKIPYRKETKKSVLETDLKTGIYALEAGEVQVEINSLSSVAAYYQRSFFSPEHIITVPCVRMTLNASSSGNIKPSAVFEKFCEFAGIHMETAACQITRLETYMDLAKEGTEHEFVPLCK